MGMTHNQRPARSGPDTAARGNISQLGVPGGAGLRSCGGAAQDVRQQFTVFFTASQTSSADELVSGEVTAGAAPVTGLELVSVLRKERVVLLTSTC